MKAAVCRGFGDPLVIEDVTLAAPGPDQIEVTMNAVAICHSDLSYAAGIWGGELPAVYGHEAAGVVTKVGENVSGIALGDHVCVTLIRSCGSCPSCARGARSECDQDWDKSQSPIASATGEKVVRAMNCGAFAERIVVDPSQCAVIPKTMPFDVASLISCGVITGIGAVVNTAKVGLGDTVVVMGAGGVGLNAIQGAALAGARKIIALDLHPEKLEAAKEFGATDGVLADAPDVIEQVKALNNGRGVDYIFVTVGVTSAYAKSQAFLAKGGAVVLVGIPPSGAMVEYEPADVADGSYRYLGSSMGQTNVARDIPWIVDMYEQGRLKLDELITGRWKLDQINDAFADTKKGLARRNVIMFD